MEKDLTFSGDSYVELSEQLLNLDGLDDKFSEVWIKMELTPASPDGLIIWYGDRTMSSWGGTYAGYFLALSVVSGFLEVQYNFGIKGVQKVSSTSIGMEGRIHDGQRHNVALQLGQRNLVLHVDALSVNGPSYGDNMFPNKNLYLGQFRILA